MRLTEEERRERSFAVLRDKRGEWGDFTIPKIDNSGQAFYGVAAKLHDALPRPRVSQDVLGFVRVRAKCVSAPLKTTTFPREVSFSARTLPEMCEKQNRISESVFGQNDATSVRAH